MPAENKSRIVCLNNNGSTQSTEPIGGEAEGKPRRGGGSSLKLSYQILVDTATDIEFRHLVRARPEKILPQPKIEEERTGPFNGFFGTHTHHRDLSVLDENLLARQIRSNGPGTIEVTPDPRRVKLQEAAVKAQQGIESAIKRAEPVVKPVGRGLRSVGVSAKEKVGGRFSEARKKGEEDEVKRLIKDYHSGQPGKVKRADAELRRLGYIK